MEQFQQVIEGIKKDQDFPTQLDLIEALISNEGAILKPQTKILLQAMSKMITSSQSSPRTKFYTIMIAKDFTVKKYIMFISCLSSSQLLQDMLRLAREVDPKKRMSEKGLNLFPSDKELGNRYITLILECICKWSEKHPKTSSKSDTKFRIGYNELCDRQVVLPKEFIYFPTDVRPSPSEEKPLTSTPTGNRDSSSSPVNEKTAESALKHSMSKIEGFFNFLESCEDEDDLIREVKRYHRLFQEDMTKMQNNSNQYLETLNEGAMQVYFDINEFYTTEGNVYKRTLEVSNDVDPYIDGLYPALELVSKHFSKKVNLGKPEHKKEAPPARIPEPQKPPSRQNGSKISKPKSELPPPPEKLPLNQDKKPYEDPPLPKQPSSIKKIQRQDPPSRISEKRESREEYEKNERESKIYAENMEKALHQLERDAERGEENIKKFLSGTAPSVPGFSSVRFQIERQKGASQYQNRQQMKASRSKHKFQSVTPVSHYRSKSPQQQNFRDRSLSQSKVTVFDLFPEMVISKTAYTGQVVPMDLTYARQLLEMSEAQGMKKFKGSNFKEKSLLFEDEIIQVGFKSTAYYQRLESYKAFLKITMFVGNKTDYQITHLETEFEGDRTVLIYSNPKKINSIIEPGYQAKQELLVIPVDVPFNLINLRLKFMLNRQFTKINLFLPTTLLKFIIFRKMPVTSFRPRFREFRSHMLRTVPFKLSRSLPPQTLVRYIGQILEITQYQRFISQTSYLQYKLCTSVSVMNLQDYLLKIRIRPDMSVILQLVPLTPNESSSSPFGVFLLQTLQFLLERQT